MKVGQSSKNGVTIFELDGQLDSTTTAELQFAVMQVAQTKNPRIALGFTKVDYVSSAGLRVVLVAAKQVRTSDGKIAIFGLTNPVRETFEISGFATMIPIVETEKDAIKALQA